MRSKPVARWGVVVAAAAMIAVLAIAFVTPPPYEVHSPGSSRLSVATYASDLTVGWVTGGPSQSLADMHCIFHISQPADQPQHCDANSVSNHFPGLTQGPQVVYLIRPQCIWIENGHDMRSLSFNADFIPATRALVIHCHATSELLLVPMGNFGSGMREAPTQALLAISTASIGAGSVTVSEEDRLERVFGDESTTFQIGTTAIA